MYFRKQELIDSQNESLFLWGARQTGKSTLLKTLFPDALWFDLLLSDVYERLLRNPSLLRETIAAGQYKVVIIDEIQRIPEQEGWTTNSHVSRNAWTKPRQRCR